MSDFETHPIGTADRINALEAALIGLLRHDFSDECQECGIGQSDEWEAAKRIIKPPDQEDKG